MNIHNREKGVNKLYNLEENGRLRCKKTNFVLKLHNQTQCCACHVKCLRKIKLNN